MRTTVEKVAVAVSFAHVLDLDHQILGVHYVRQVPNYTVYNLTFQAVGGVGLLLVGWLLMQTRRRDVIEL